MEFADEEEELLRDHEQSLRQLEVSEVCKSYNSGLSTKLINGIDICTLHAGRQRVINCITVLTNQGAPWSWKVMEFRKTIFQAWKVMENSKGHGKSWKMMMMSWNFYYCTEQFCRSDTTSFIKSNYEPQCDTAVTVFTGLLTDQF